MIRIDVPSSSPCSSTSADKSWLRCAAYSSRSRNSTNTRGDHPARDTTHKQATTHQHHHKQHHHSQQTTMAQAKLTAENFRQRQQMYVTPLGGLAQTRTKRWVENLTRARPPAPPSPSPSPEPVREEEVAAVLKLVRWMQLWVRWLVGV